METRTLRYSESSCRRTIRWFSLFIALWTAGCDAKSSPPPLEVEYAGCAEVSTDSECLLPPGRELRLWILTLSDASLELTAVDESEVPVRDAVEIDGGRRLTVVLPAGSPRLQVRARTKSGESLWQLAMTSEKLGQGHAEVESQAAESAALGYQAMRGGEFDLAIEHLTAVRQAYGAMGWRLSEVRTAGSIVYCQIQQRRFNRVRAVLESFQLDGMTPGEVRYQKSFFEGLAAVASGDSRTALLALSKASSRARRLGMQRELGMSEEVLGLHLRQLGRAREATEVFARLQLEESYGLRAADRARLLNNYAWTLLLAHEAGEGTGDPLPLLEEARRSFDAHAELIDQRVNVRLNLALAYLHAGRPREAEECLAEAAELAAEPPVHLRLWWLDIEARVALGQGRNDEALRLYQRLDQLAVSASDPEGRWRAAVGRARAHMARGMQSKAHRALAEAEELLDEQGLQVPLDQGRETFMAQRGMSVRLHLELLLEDGQIAKAFETARRSRSRVLRTLRYQNRLAQLNTAERVRWEEGIAEYWRLRERLDALLSDDWRLSSEELSGARLSRLAVGDEISQALDRAFAVFGADTETPLPEARPGELVLAYHPLVDGWVGFAASAGEVASHRFKLPAAGSSASQEELASVLLHPFQTAIFAAERVRILPYGALREVDFHALPLAGDALLAARPVVYGLDLATPAGIEEQTPRQALVISDPRSDLVAARREADRVGKALAKVWQPWRVETLGGEAAARETVSNRLRRVDLLHYAGHGAFSGRGGWESALPLAGDTRLTAGDLLALESPPRWVVLSGCETAKVASSGVESLGLAHAFLLAGSLQVVATTRPVGDLAAEALFEGFYRDLGETPDLAMRLRQAQLERRREGDSDWASFRVLEP